MTDYKRLCAELCDDLEEWVDGYLINDPADEHTAASFERINRARAALAEPQYQIPKNCWLDDEPDLCPSPCVFDDPDERIDNCVFAQRLRAAGEAKTQCKYYRQCDQLDPQSLQGEAS